MSGEPAQTPAISVERVSKAFRLPHEQSHTLKERAMHPFRARQHDTLRALRDVSFHVEEGEYFGIVGRNGSGKSTLLKCLAGIYQVDHGRVLLRGRLAPFIELGVGFNPDLTARDNVVINAVMLGLTPAQARERYDEIIRFAELEQFVDLKLKNYSSGMQVRLAFAVMVQVDADILLIDEVLAVGDAAFQQKCHDTLNRMRTEGRTIVLVTHDMEAVKRVCDRAMLLERGRIVTIDRPEEVARQYNEINFQREVARVAPADAAPDHGEAAIRQAWFEDDEGRRAAVLPQGAPCVVCVELHVREPVEDPLVTVTLTDEKRRRVLTAGTATAPAARGHFAAGERVELAIRFDNQLAAGRYAATVTLAHGGTGANVIDVRPDVASVLVTGSHGDGAVLVVDPDVAVRRRGTAPPVAAAADPSA